MVDRAAIADPSSSSVDRLRDRVYGGEDFLRRMLLLASGEDGSENKQQLRRISPVTTDQIINATAAKFEVDASTYQAFRSSAGGRDLAAYLCRRYPGATLRQLSKQFGFGHPHGSEKLVRRATKRLAESPQLRDVCQQIKLELGLKAEGQA